MDFLIAKLVAVLPLEESETFVTNQLVNAIAKLVLVEKNVIHVKMTITYQTVNVIHVIVSEIE